MPAMNRFVSGGMFLFLLLVSAPHNVRAEWVLCNDRKVYLGEPGFTGYGVSVYYPGANNLLFKDSESAKIRFCLPIGFGWTLEGFKTFPGNKPGTEVALFEISAGGDHRYFDFETGSEIFLQMDERGGLLVSDQPDLRPGTIVTVLQNWTGGHSLIEAAEYRRIATHEDWKALWERHAGPYVPVPRIDFIFHMALAIFAGEKMNSPGVAVDEIRETDDALVVYFRPILVKPDGPHQTANPFGLFVLKKSNKRVIFKENLQATEGGPSQWKTVHEMDVLP